MTLCKQQQQQQGAYVSHNVLNPHWDPNRITSKIEFNVKL